MEGVITASAFWFSSLGILFPPVVWVILHDGALSVQREVVSKINKQNARARQR